MTKSAICRAASQRHTPPACRRRRQPAQQWVAQACSKRSGNKKFAIPESSRRRSNCYLLCFAPPSPLLFAPACLPFLPACLLLFARSLIFVVLIIFRRLLFHCFIEFLFTSFFAFLFFLRYASCPSPPRALIAQISADCLVSPMVPLPPGQPPRCSAVVTLMILFC